MISKEDPYKILNIKKDASKSEIKRAYRSLVKKWHPDMNTGDPGAEERFKEIQQAYDFLINEKTNPDQNRDIDDQFDNDYISSVHDHPFQSLREAVIKYYADRGWFKNKVGKDHKG